MIKNNYFYRIIFLSDNNFYLVFVTCLDQRGFCEYFSSDGFLPWATLCMLQLNIEKIFYVEPLFLNRNALFLKALLMPARKRGNRFLMRPQ